MNEWTSKKNQTKLNQNKNVNKTHNFDHKMDRFKFGDIKYEF